VFLGHVVELLHSGVPHVRTAAIDALDRLLTGALGPAAAAAAAEAAAALPRPPPRPPTPAAGAARGGAAPALAPPPLPPPAPLQAGDIERMLLVALESVYKEEREPDVRQGLLRVTLHVLQRHGEHLGAGWVPLLRLLEAVPSWDDAATIGTAFQCVESICRRALEGAGREGARGAAVLARPQNRTPNAPLSLRLPDSPSPTPLPHVSTHPSIHPSIHTYIHTYIHTLRTRQSLSPQPPAPAPQPASC
jgi:hypothetical protein